MSHSSIPDSLAAWVRTNERYDAAVAAGAPAAERAAIYTQMIVDWYDAPVADRFKVDWRYLKRSWRERNDQQRNEG
jgi:hypothetical protein